MLVSPWTTHNQPETQRISNMKILVANSFMAAEQAADITGSDNEEYLFSLQLQSSQCYPEHFFHGKKPESRDLTFIFFKAENSNFFILQQQKVKSSKVTFQAQKKKILKMF